MLKKRTASEKQKAMVREWLDEKQSLLPKEEITIGELDAKAWKLMDGAMELYAQAEACADTIIKQPENFNAQVTALAQQEQVVADRELKLQDREEQDDLRLDRELEALTTRESDLSSREANLAVERKDLEEIRTRILARELTVDIKDVHLNSMEEELADWEKRLVQW
jgi:hypothetical protein